MTAIQTQTTIQSNSNGLDDYGYPLPPDRKAKLRKLGIRGSKGALGVCISIFMTVVGFLLWLGRRGKQPSPLTP